MKDNQAKYPQLRFKGFTDPWVQRNLSDLATFSKGKGYSKSDLVSDGFPAILYGRMYTNYESQIDDISDTFVADATDAVLSQTGDVIVPGSGETPEDIARASNVNVSGIVLGGDINIIRPDTEKMDSTFLALTISNGQQQTELIKRAQGKSVVHLHNSDLKKVNVVAPSKDEQSAISSLFTQLDNLIAANQRKLTKLKELKQGYLQKLFPKNGEKVPELRFAGFADDWEERKLGDIAPLRGGFAFKSSKFRNTGVPIVRISNILSSGEVGGDFAYYDEQDKDDKYILPDKSAVLAMSGATTGKVSILSQTDYDKVYQNQRVGYFQSVDYIDYGFISTIVRSELFMMQLESVLVSGAQPNVSSKEIDSFNFMIPILVQEQQKIGSFFKQLDDTIALHQRKLDLLKEQKKGFLQKMFV